MKYIIPCLLFIASFISSNAQTFKYAFVTDTHVGTDTGEEDLRRTVNDINQQNDLDFILVTGDVTEMGTKLEIKLAREVLGGLKKPWYVIPGNHDTGWSESGGVDFIRAFGDDKFTFDHKGFRFIACASGPYVRMSDGHIPRDAVVWLDKVLKETPKTMPVVFINHYPIDNSLDNWYEATDRIKKYNIQYAICGHGHANKAFDFEGVPGTMGRSNLRAKDSIGGYNIVTMRSDSVFFAVKKPGVHVENTWRSIPLGKFTATSTTKPERPDYTVNSTFPQVQQTWTYHAAANVVSTPAANKELVVFGNSIGEVEAVSISDGRKKWGFKTGGAIYSSPVISGDRVILGSGDGSIYALNVTSGKQLWKLETKASVLGSPVIAKDVVYIGGSDHHFRAIDLKTGKQIWDFDGVEGAIVDKPLLYEGKVIFGSWGRHLYALDQLNGALLWKWNNGSANRMFSPAMCRPVADQGIVFIAAPDRVLTAIDASNGTTLWRNKEATVRESIGITEDGKTILGKTMNDEIVAYRAQATDPGVLWRLNVGFGYDHVPSMLIEKEGQVFFGTRNGVVYAIDPVLRKTIWAHKIDNSMVNTVNVLDKHTVVVATMDGKVTLLKIK
ncbi:PQQ-binding-like beta-propeller repeat protein [Pedobacter sp. MC2016-24]|uniref:outer membrane protein assembly factor BamB family protein n=1 Tax=Pedobacter sp. MC2016-24 TaxID=2780090 RepID=UPI00187F3051|nr:PQQ-binding-like beta-propeller repeat protein [Pedobacter sp. MC2016-24]MBE9600086.1 PQQ-binding-like beta-propeller repeat protein [Pedobacter sp. MC2016-24]